MVELLFSEKFSNSLIALLAKKNFHKPHTQPMKEKKSRRDFLFSIQYPLHFQPTHFNGRTNLVLNTYRKFQLT